MCKWERGRERERRVCVNVRATTALGCWRHALAVCVCARVCRYVCDSCTQHASVNVCMRLCVYSHIHLRVVFLVHVCECVCESPHSPPHTLVPICLCSRACGRRERKRASVCVGAHACACVCPVKYSNISVCCFCLPAALPL